MKIIKYNKSNEFGITKRLVFAWSEVRATANEPHLYGAPNKVEMKFKDKEGNEVGTENSETAEGRNIIRGQAILMLRKFPYEDFDMTDDNKIRISSSSLHFLIRTSRQAEMGLLLDDDKNLIDPVEQTTKLKIQLDAFRSMVTTKNEETGRITFNKPSHINLGLSFLTEIPDGRNYLRSEALKFLKATLVNEENKDDIKALREALAKSTKIETGQWFVEHPDERPADKEGLEKLKQESATALHTALTEVLPPPSAT